MRRITEATAKVIEEALEAQITALQPRQRQSLRVANKIRLLQNAKRELITNKIIKPKAKCTK